MVTVTLPPGGRATVQPVRLPRRFRLPPGDLEVLAARRSTPLPWPAATDAALSATTGTTLLTPLGEVIPEVAEALAVFGAPELAVDLDLALTGDGGPRVHAWHRWRAGRVTHLATALADQVELAWYDDRRWQAELSRALQVPRTAQPPGPPGLVIELPHDLLLGTGEALARSRADVYDELVARETGAVRADGDVLDLTGVHEQLRLLHGSVLARLLAVGSGVRGRAERRTGWVSWLLFADGWRALTPYLGEAGGRPRAMVRVEPRRPGDLAIEVARWVAEVRS